MDGNASAPKELCITSIFIHKTDPLIVYNYLTDADGELYKKIVENTLINEPKKRILHKTHRPIKSRVKCGTSTGAVSTIKRSKKDMLREAHRIYAGDLSYRKFIESLKG